MKRNVGPDKAVEELGDRTLGEPLPKRVEEQLGATVTVLLPAVELQLSQS